MSYTAPQESIDIVPEIPPALSEEEYIALANMEVGPKFHAFGRAVFAAGMFVRMGGMVIEKSQGFIDAQGEISKGGVIVASVHRDELETLDLPCALERVGICKSRPVAKSSIFDVPIPIVGALVRETVLRWGAVPVKRGAKDKSGLNAFQTALLDPQRDPLPGNASIYNEKKRVRTDVRDVRREGSGVVLAAGVHDSLVSVVGIGGLSTEIDPDTDEKIARDKRYWLGTGPRRVYVFPEPFKFGLLDGVAEYQRGELDGSDLETFRAEKDRRNEFLYDRMQEALDRAYEIRGSSLEKKYSHRVSRLMKNLRK